MIKVEIHGAYAACVQPQLLTTGMVGAVVEFSFDEVWDGLTKCAVFTDGVVAKDVLLHGNTCVIPHEVLTTDGRLLSVGVYGANAADDVVVPTVYTSIGMVSFGADPSGDESYPPTPDVAAQIFGRIEKLESGNGGEDTGTAIIDVSALPTEDINEDVLYRLTTGMVVFNGQNGRVFDDTAVYIVDSLPEIGEPCSSDIGESTAIYYNTSNGVAYGYIDDRASVSLIQPVGWKSASTAFAAMGYQYSGVVTSMNDVARSSAAVLLEYTLYHYKNGWKRVSGATPFVDLSNLGLEAVDLAGVADGVSVRVGTDTRAIINALARGAVKFGFQIIYNGATLDVEAVGSAMYLEAENTYQIHNFNVFANTPMMVTISVDEHYVSVSVAAAQSGGTSTTLPNPHKLTFSGAVSAEYDGSEPVEVVIPEGGGPDGAATETWQLLADITLEEEVNNIETEYFATPQRKIRVVLDTLAAETAALATPVKVRTGDVNWNRLVFFYPAPVPAVNVVRSIYEVEVLGDGKAMVAWNSVRNLDVQNGVGVELYARSTSSGKMLLEPVDYYENKINDEITGFAVGTYSTFAAGTRLRVWGVAK